MSNLDVIPLKVSHLFWTKIIKFVKPTKKLHKVNLFFIMDDIQSGVVVELKNNDENLSNLMSQQTDDE